MNKRILITGKGSFVGNAVEAWLSSANNAGRADGNTYEVAIADTVNDAWRDVDFSKFDTVFHVAGIAHVDPKPEMAPLYYKVNRDLTVEIARHAKKSGVKQFIFMSSMIVYHASKSLDATVIDAHTGPNPNDFYGDSKLQAENGLHALESDDFKVALLRPCMIYGPEGKGNFRRLAALARKTPIFPDWHNRRSMLYIDNLCEFVRQTIDRDLSGTFHLQNAEYADTVEIVRYFAEEAGKKIWISKAFNPCVWLGAKLLKPVSKMFADQYYTQELTTFDFPYQTVSFSESLKKFRT